MREDRRLYMAEPGWTPKLNRGDFRMFCHHLEAGENHYHRIANGEIYVCRDDENYCFNCACKRGILTAERPTLENQGFLRF